MGLKAGVNLGDRFLAAAASTPDADAIVVAGVDPIRLTYAQLTDRVWRLASVLHGRGVGAGDRVGVLLANGNEHLETLLAAFLLRAVPINLSFLDGADEVRSVVDQSRVGFVVREPDLDTEATESIARGDDYEAALARAGSAPIVEGRSGDDRYVLYTGGTTGRPKGVVWRHDDLYRGALEPAGGHHTRAVRCLPASPFAHGTGQWMALTTLLNGGTVICRRDRHLDASTLLNTIDEHDVSFLVTVGDAFARPLVDAIRAHPARWSLSSLTTVLSGGAVLSPGVKEELLRVLPTVLVVDGFGASESGGHGRMVSVAGVVPAGPPRFVVDDDTAVLDDDHRPIAPGDRRLGWIARRGSIPLGYDGDDHATAITFPVVDGVRWALPGDRARHEADGSITVLGRGVATINTGGHKVQAEEVEAALRDHPAVRDAVVVGVPDGRFGERIAAVVAPREHMHPTLDALAQHCRDRIAGYKVPRHLVLVDEVRRSAAGKLDYAWALEVASA